MFYEKALELQAKFDEAVGNSCGATTKAAATELDVLGYFSKITLDVIGLAGFGYEIRSIHGPNQLADAFLGMVKALYLISPLNILQVYFKPAQKLVSAARSAPPSQPDFHRAAGFRETWTSATESSKASELYVKISAMHD